MSVYGTEVGKLMIYYTIYSRKSRIRCFLCYRVISFNFLGGCIEKIKHHNIDAFVCGNL